MWLRQSHRSTVVHQQRIASYSKKDDVLLIHIINGKLLSDYTRELCNELSTENQKSNLEKNEMCLLQYIKEENTLERLY